MHCERFVGIPPPKELLLNSIFPSLQAANLLRDWAAEGVVLQVDDSEEREVTYVRRERSHKALRLQRNGNDSAWMSFAAGDAIPSAEM